MSEDRKDRKRPDVGTEYRKTERVPICKGCGCMVDSTGGCNYGCGHDFEKRTKDNTFHAVYSVVETFMGDEPFIAWSGRKRQEAD